VKICSHENLIACVELGRTLSLKVSTDAFLFKVTKGSYNNYELRKQRSVLIDCLLDVPWRIHLGFIYTTQLLSLYNSSNRLLSLYNSTS
jgi:hypothetical protein